MQISLFRLILLLNCLIWAPNYLISPKLHLFLPKESQFEDKPTWIWIRKAKLKHNATLSPAHFWIDAQSTPKWPEQTAKEKERTKEKEKLVYSSGSTSLNRRIALGRYHMSINFVYLLFICLSSSHLYYHPYFEKELRLDFVFQINSSF